MKTRLKKSDILIVIAVNSIIGTLMWTNYYTNLNKSTKIESNPTIAVVNNETDQKK